MSVQRIASRYAKSLIDLAVEQDKLERILEDVNAFRSATKNRDFYLLMKSPIVSSSKKLDIVNAIFENKFDALTLSFLKILITKGREAYLPDIAVEFLSQYKKIKHISTVTVTTATELSEKAKKALLAKLQASSSTDDNIEIITKVDPDLIGGFILEFDDKVYDTSVSHKLEQLKKDFGENLYISQIIAS